MKIVAITSCPTGVAHTYMAANALKKSATANNVEIKVETQGSDGIGNELTAEDIKNADYALFAADKPVENKDRFIGKKIIEVPVTEAVKNSDNLIKNIISGNIKSYTLEASGDEDLDDLLQTSKRKGIYKHLMAGFSNMLPFIIAGGICIGISFAFGITASNPQSPDYNPIAGFFDTIGGGKVGAFSLIIAILSAYIANSVGGKSAFMPGMVAGLLANYYKTGFLGGILAGFVAGYVAILLKKLLNNIPKSISSLKGALLYPLFGLILTCLILWPVFMPIAKLMDLMVQGLNGISASHKGIIGLIVGGMMATDMGGPINKTAGLFANAAFASGNADFMSAMMAGGMVPPLGIALCTTLFAKYFTETERKAGKTCYFLGACFITEGVIPFAVSDPVRVIVSSMIGAMVSGFLTQYFNIVMMASHGGIFVIPITNKPILYTGIIILGSIITALVLGFWKKFSAKKININY
ncbi:putative phosphotransferase system enzyme IIBC [Brachyspira pilosicoli WesB]|uniref:Putative phosphotransferase system enzyme IIBC n=1 Tax=Brachyspira pilosicoli WesB TaxID=1161918 RepID=K0JLB8_BRAPL|nr:fructose-specific PTS transporter subunit EIIC [Brachyspira pilosicoli]CCG57887.1 putative phosphotransferase system enzyme IIBC [Brachyspira pilosicoli WesB]